MKQNSRPLHTTSKFLGIGLFSLIISGCATIFGGTEQQITLSTKCKARSMPTVCTAQNDKGVWTVETPSTFFIKRSAEDLIISCQGGLFGTYSFKAVSSFGLPMWGNLIAGGGVGAIVDLQNSTAFEYQKNIVIEPPICKFV